MGKHTPTTEEVRNGYMSQELMYDSQIDAGEEFDRWLDSVVGSSYNHGLESGTMQTDTQRNEAINKLATEIHHMYKAGLIEYLVYSDLIDLIDEIPD